MLTMPGHDATGRPIPPWRALVYEQYEPTGKSLEWLRERGGDLTLGLVFHRPSMLSTPMRNLEMKQSSGSADATRDARAAGSHDGDAASRGGDEFIFGIAPERRPP